jgi:uncharacterized membrane protein YeiH
MRTASTLLVVVDLIGTAVFALSGALAGVRRKLDLFGVLVLSFAAATAGGITRDLLIGDVPPEAMRNWRYVAVAFVAGIATFFWYPVINQLHDAILVFDATGLALFAVSGTEKALAYGLNPVMAALLGMLTGIGGGMVRDVLTAQIPVVLHSDVYAIAALAGAAVVVVGHATHLSAATATAAGALLCFFLRFMAIRRHWQIPVAHLPEEAAKK